jgi:acyl carrier protein
VIDDALPSGGSVARRRIDDSMRTRSTIRDALVELFEEDELEVPEISDDLVLLETELDSLGFAVLVTRLEETLGYDPFSMMTEPVYPTTFGEFVAVYEQFAPPADAADGP